MWIDVKDARPQHGLDVLTLNTDGTPVKKYCCLNLREIIFEIDELLWEAGYGEGSIYSRVEALIQNQKEMCDENSGVV